MTELHGCEVCRSHEARALLVGQCLEQPGVQVWLARCPHCLAPWKVSFVRVSKCTKCGQPWSGETGKEPCAAGGCCMVNVDKYELQARFEPVKEASDG